MRKAGPITLTGWSRLQPDATQAQTPDMAALAMSDWLPHRADPINGSSMTISKDELVEIAGRAIQRRQTRTPDAAEAIGRYTIACLDRTG
jgi:hypothetical protein